MGLLAYLLRRLTVAAGAVACTAAFGACVYTSDAALSPPLKTFYFPTGLVVSPGRTSLYIVNSDFDLQYNGGTVQVMSLDAVRPDLLTLIKAFRDGKGASEACPLIGVIANNNCESTAPFQCVNDVLNPGPCAPIVPTDKRPLVQNFASVGAFASGAIYVQRPEPGKARLFVPVRGDPSITFFDVDDDRDPDHIAHPCGKNFCLDCGGQGADRRCDANHQLGENPFENTRDLTIPTEPVGIAASDDGSALVAAHDDAAAVSLSQNSWDIKPSLQYVAGGLSTAPSEVASLPMPAYLAFAQKQTPPLPFDYQPGFLVTFEAAPEVDLFRYSSDADSSPPRPYLTLADKIGITANADGKDSRGIAIDATARRACEAGCTSDVGACLLECAKQNNLGVFIANRSPATLLVGEIKTTLALSDDQDGATATGAFDELTIFDTIPLDTGPSHVAIGQVIDADGKLATKVFAVCFDTRFVFMYDPVSYRVEASFRTGRGPQAMAFDTSPDRDHSLLYVAHFTDSYIGVVDLDMRNPTFGTMFASLGEPLPPRESK